MASELEALLDATILDVSHRELRFRVPQLTTELLSIGSVDDLFIPWGTICNIDHTRASLNTLKVGISAIGMVEALTQVRRFRQPSQEFDVVASYLGRHNYSRCDIEDAVGPALARVINGTYVSRRAGPMPRTTLSFRIHISERTAQLSVRLAEFPLHRRAYKVGSQRGTLHPPLAYCMAMIAGVSDDTRLLDPFCGVGTILIESSRVAPYASLLGTDIDAKAIRMARLNAASAKCKAEFIRMDAGELALPSNSMERIISNMPWGRTVAASGTLRSTFSPFWSELDRVLTADGRAVVLMEHDIKDNKTDVCQPDNFRRVLQIRLRLFGRWATLVVLSRHELDDIFDMSTTFGPVLMRRWQWWRESGLDHELSLS